jgi:DNA-binding LacI/PurR family transcriptional regulator
VIQAPVSTNLSMVARRIEGDIRARGLRSGDRYLSVSDAAHMFGVSAATAHRAMDLLVSRKLLVRQHGRGTFVGDGAPAPRRGLATRVRTVQILLPEEQEGVSPFPMAEPILHAVRRGIGGVNVQFAFVPAFGAVEYVRELVGAAHEAGQLAGVIPISCPRDVYAYLDRLDVPMVVLGSLCPDQDHIASVDADYRQVGRLLAGHMVGRKHRRMAVFVGGEGRPGDHAFLDGISDVLTEAGLPHNAMTVRIFPRDFDAFRAQVAELLSRPDRPDGVICGTSRLVEVVVATAASLGLSVPGDLDLAYYGESTGGTDATLTRVEMTERFESVAGTLAGMLKRLIAAERVDPRRVIVPVRLVEAPARAPSGRANGS